MENEKNYLEYLAELYPTIEKAATEIINLQSVINLPKGTEHFLSDIHGEYEAFSHVLRNGSGAVRKKIDDVFGHTLGISEKRALATLIYYPRERLEMEKKQQEDIDDWYKVMLYRLIDVCKIVSSKYTRAKVRKALPADYGYIIEELITEKPEVLDKEAYYEAIIQTILEIGSAENFIIAVAELIQRLVVDHLHIIGDIFDRGPEPYKIMDCLMNYHSLDIQWGNHDVLWMGAAAGQMGCIANAIRICARYGNLDILEDGYGIKLLPLATFAINTYGDDPCTCFQLKGSDSYSASEREMNQKMHKAISIIQFKAEGQIIKRHPEFGLEKRNLLHHIDFERGVLELGGKEYKMLDMNFPTVDPKDPYAFTPEEADIMERLERAFMNCEKLQQHMKFLLAKGSLYKVYNNNLLYHGCVPLNKDGTFKEVEIYGKQYKGKALYDILDNYVRKGFVAVDKAEREKGRDMMWYIWLNENSPLFGKDKMATFERYFLAEKETHKEVKNPYYDMLENEEVLDRILREFGLEPEGAHIINGHVPVKSKDGESPLKCGGKLLVIDGGFSRAYQKETGIAGYTLIYNSYGLILAAHDPFESTEAAIEKESDIHSESRMVKWVPERKCVGDTDIGRELKEKIKDLEKLLNAYYSGAIAEKFTR